jgi:hypothetical protein
MLVTTAHAKTNTIHFRVFRETIPVMVSYLRASIALPFQSAI